jgi:long-subunit fatty acid transport protein
MKFRRWLPLFGALTVLHSGAARAQAPILLPPSLIAPNYDRVFPGLTESIEAGADIARARGADAVWYNPAGIALARRTQLNASSQGYQLTLLGGTGLRDVGLEVSNFRGLPNYVGIVFGEEVIPWRSVRIGFAISNPISWEQNISVSVTPTPGNRITLLDQSSFENFQAIAAVGYAVSRTLRFGFSVNFPHTDAGSQESYSTGTTTDVSTSASRRTLAFNGNALHILLTASTQWEPLPWLSLGAVLKTPGLHILGGGSVTYEALLTQQGPNPALSTQVFLRDNGANFDYRIPLEVDGGVAVRFGPVEVELSLRWHQASGTYTALSSSTQAQVTTAVGSNPPVLTSLSLPPQLWGTRSIVNGSFGGHYRLSELVTLHAGVYADQAPAGSASPLLQFVNIYGLRVGASFTTQTLSASIGLGYEVGSSNRALITDSGSTQTQTLNAQTLSILYSLSYDF